MAALYEVGKKVKVEVDGLPYAATIITYKDDDPVTYIVSIDGLETKIITETDISGELDGNNNPNTVQTVTGTMDDPWGDVDYSELCAALNNGKATADITADATTLGFGEISQPVQSHNGTTCFTNGASITDIEVQANAAIWEATGSITHFDIYAGGTITDALAYASLVPTTLTIIWHPLS